MNSEVDQQIQHAYAGFYYAIAIGVVLYFAKVILSIILRQRLGNSQAPGLNDDQPQAFFSRVVSLVGANADPARTFGETRLRATIGLRLVSWGGVAALAYFHHQMAEKIIGPGSFILVLVAINALSIELYQITFDRAHVTLPRWWFGRTTHRWRDLVAVIDREAWLVTFHFSDGRKVKVHKYIVGYDELMALAKDAVRNV